jgi:hypothetical protein
MCEWINPELVVEIKNTSRRNYDVAGALARLTLQNQNQSTSSSPAEIALKDFWSVQLQAPIPLIKTDRLPQGVSALSLLLGQTPSVASQSPNFQVKLTQQHLSETSTKLSAVESDVDVQNDLPTNPVLSAIPDLKLNKQTEAVAADPVSPQDAVSASAPSSTSLAAGFSVEMNERLVNQAQVTGEALASRNKSAVRPGLDAALKLRNERMQSKVWSKQTRLLSSQPASYSDFWS